MDDERKKQQANSREAAVITVVGVVTMVLLIGTGTSVFGGVIVGIVCFGFAAALMFGAIR